MFKAPMKSPFPSAGTRKALTGNRVYKGGMTAPNKGAVSAKGAMGYVKREMLKNRKRTVAAPSGGISRPAVSPKGKDGKSDRRSQVAALALQRRRTMMNR